MKRKFQKINLILPAAHGQLEKTNLGRSDMDSGEMKGAVFNIGMISGAFAVHGSIRLAELVPTNECSSPHLLRRAGTVSYTHLTLPTKA